ncbi:putative vascular endothelial growth factor 2-like [Homarus americanus]|uniref:Putative vascular endothelial growth factor 2-like n=1 Tax=Homarus americanus TaxID=6706 RepID=A0A8J5K2Y7_HOMAM|nr:putative vascular endothelial growth factor 2-like [Homarus americanus]
MKVLCLLGCWLALVAVAQAGNAVNIMPGVAPIFFPGQPIPDPGQPIPDPGLELPEDLNSLDMVSLSRLNSIRNISEFAKLFKLDLPSDGPSNRTTITLRVGDLAGSTSKKATMANCVPEMTTVSLNLPTESNVMYYPTCVRLEQCGGCCFGPHLTCRPKTTEVVKFKVLRTVMTNSVRRRSNRRRRQNEASYHEVEVIKHTDCECGCKIQEQDCIASIQTYNEAECSCVCKNRDEKAKCEKQNSTKYWDNDSCSCYCRKTQPCGSGEIFSQVSCKCEQLASRSGFGFPENNEEGSTA